MLTEKDFKLQEYINTGVPVTLIKILEFCRHNESLREVVGLMRVINDRELNIIENHYKKYIILQESFKTLGSSLEGIQYYQRYYGMDLEEYHDEE